VVGLAFGGLLGLRARSDNEKSLDHCPDSPNRCDATGVSLREDAKKSADLATIALIAGGTLATGGLVLVLAAPKGASAEGGRGELRARLVAAPGVSAVSLGGSF
ncbi:MAG: hypothetical protein FJ104_13360, partial [Deltaproteobacteria bacterium]|nr:hypothetical protein [Deltaproteobacteria bacterium]